MVHKELPDELPELWVLGLLRGDQFASTVHVYAIFAFGPALRDADQTLNDG